ncbi:MAG TPA: glycoside hydrolase family 30 beta sandwich domain-containing protein [Flavisolibacter sp.]|nr:glycoside hydrolase family 30 beta sandwich domain-containing protein [Flavisolibacter sp.]
MKCALVRHMKTNKRLVLLSKFFFTAVVLAALTGCNQGKDEVIPPPVEPPSPVNEVDFWLTKSDETVKLQKQTGVLAFTTLSTQYPGIDVDENISFQTIDGFGYTLTGGSAQVINSLEASKKKELLQELFGSDESAIHVSYLRISMGASDLNGAPFTYDDMPPGQTDMTLASFSLSADSVLLVPLLKEILAVNPQIKILATPWSAPVWMKDNHSYVGGSLQPQYYAVYAQYFVKYIQAMKAQGIVIDAITPQNEPLHGGNNPSMVMQAAQQADFIRNHLGPAFQAANIATKIIIYDHNCDKPDYPIAILNDATAKSFINGSAFHLYAGDISALSTVRNAHPDKAVYFTEQYTASNGNFGGDLNWHLKNVIIGSMRNWSRVALEWNLANDASFGPHTEGGCTVCKGAITITSGSSFTRNVSYYIIAHASKFVPPGSARIFSSVTGSLNNVAFKTPAGKKVLIVENDGNTSQQFTIKFNGKVVITALAAGAVGTYVW